MVADLVPCIRADLDCADICAATGAVLTRQTAPKPPRPEYRPAFRCRFCVDPRPGRTGPSDSTSLSGRRAKTRNNSLKRKAPVMMWGYGQGMGWMWLWGVILLIGIAILVLLMVRILGGGVRNGYGPPGPQGPGGEPMGRSRARQMLDERFAAGELSAEQYREHLRVLGEGP